MILADWAVLTAVGMMMFVMHREELRASRRPCGLIRKVAPPTPARDLAYVVAPGATTDRIFAVSATLPDLPGSQIDLGYFSLN